MVVKTVKPKGVGMGVGGSRMPMIIGVAGGIIMFVLFGILIATAGGGEEIVKSQYGENPNKVGYCNLSDGQYDGLAIVVGNTQNSLEPNIDFTDSTIDSMINDAFYSGGKITVVSAAKGNYNIELFKDENERRKSRPAGNINASDNNLTQLKNKINKTIKVAPSASGVDYIGAILKARELLSSAKSKNPAILVVGSGYSDSGALNFAVDGIIDLYRENSSNGSAKEKLIAKVSQSGQIKKDALAGAYIYWYRINQVASPQDNMDEYFDDITGVYKDVFEWLGVEMSDDDFSIGSQTAEASSVDTKYTVQQTYVSELKIGDTFDVNENIGRFEPDKDILINSQEVKTKLEQFAKKFNPNNNNKLDITGYIAYCIDDGQLGFARASIIKNILVELGIPENKIEIHGEGGSRPEDGGAGHVCVDRNGDSEEAASLRRTVRIEVVEE